MKKAITVFLGFYLGFVVFMPKENIFFTVQKYLAPYKIYINADTAATPLALYLHRGTLFFDGMDIAAFDHCKLYPWLFLNLCTISDTKINVGGFKIQKLRLLYSIVNPLKIYLEGSANFGTLKGYINIKNRELKIYIHHIKNSAIKTYLQKDKEGYFYHASF